MAADPLIGTVEAAARAAVSAPTIKAAAQSGDLPIALKMPGRTGAYLFRPRDVDRWADRRSRRRRRVITFYVAADEVTAS
jgi:hypothetical protein